jgi:hypothetical protein
MAPESFTVLLERHSTAFTLGEARVRLLSRVASREAVADT